MAGVKTLIVNAFARQYTPCRVSLQRCRGQWTIHHHGERAPPRPIMGLKGGKNNSVQQE